MFRSGSVRPGRGASFVVILCGASFATWGAAQVGEVLAQPAGVVMMHPGVPSESRSGFIYDSDYPFIGYSGTPEHNDIAHLAARVAHANVKLTYSEPRGYLDSLLAALHIDPASQVLVFSKTSLQVDAIGPQTPRAIYFNDDTYVAWISGSKLLEISAMDSMMGTVFYTVMDRPSEPANFERETTRCLACHDTFSLAGGGVPNFLLLSAYTRRQKEIVTNEVANQTTDQTPLEERWGGWYVTGQLGGLKHLGNILPGPAGTVPASSVRWTSRTNLDDLFDTKPYLSDKSDVLALLALQHQVDIHNLIIHANYKCRRLMEQTSPGSSTRNVRWVELPPIVRQRFADLLEPLVRGMLFVDAAKFTTPIRSTSGFARSFEARGPRDPKGRSLRDFDLDKRLFKYPLSYLVYSEGFDFLPTAAREYVYRRFEEILTGRDESAAFSNLSPSDRHAIREILRATKPDYVRTIAELTRRAAPGNARPAAPPSPGTSVRALR